MTTSAFVLELADGMRRGQRPASAGLLYHAVAAALAGQPRRVVGREYLHVLRHAALIVQRPGQPFTTCPNCHAQLNPKEATNGHR